MLSAEIQARCGTLRGHRGALSRSFDTSAFHIKSPSGEEILWPELCAIYRGGQPLKGVPIKPGIRVNYWHRLGKEVWFLRQLGLLNFFIFWGFFLCSAG